MDRQGRGASAAWHPGVRAGGRGGLQCAQPAACHRCSLEGAPPGASGCGPPEVLLMLTTCGFQVFRHWALLEGSVS